MFAIIHVEKEIKGLHYYLETVKCTQCTLKHVYCAWNTPVVCSVSWTECEWSLDEV